MNCVHCAMEIRERPVDMFSELSGMVIEFETGMIHTTERCREVLSRERQESLQTITDVRSILAMWKAAILSEHQALIDIESQLEIDKEVKQALLSVDQEMTSLLVKDLKGGG